MLTDNNQYVMGYAIAINMRVAKSIAMHHHPDPSSAEYTAIRAYRAPSLDDKESAAFFTDGWMSISNDNTGLRNVDFLRSKGLVAGRGENLRFYSKGSDREM
jgi:hypothetical protein